MRTLVLALLALGTVSPTVGAQCPLADPAFAPAAGGGQGLNGRSLSATAFQGQLVAVGEFVAAGGSPVQAAARFDGAAWSALGNASGVNGYPRVVRSLDLGAGPELYLGNTIVAVNSNVRAPVYRWNGATWSVLQTTAWSTGVQNAVNDLVVFAEGGVPRLFALGAGLSEALVWPLQSVLRWDGATWSRVGAGLEGESFAGQVHDDGSGPALFAGTSTGVRRWDGVQWTDIGLPGEIRWLASFDAGTGPWLYASGSFSFPGASAYFGLARWDGSSWQTVPGANSLDYLGPLAVHDDGSGAGPRLWSASWGQLRAFDGSTWSSIAPIASSGLDRLESIQGIAGGNALVVCGHVTALDGLPSQGIALLRGCVQAEVLCLGDGSGPVACPCGNLGSPGRGCDNSSATGGARLELAGAAQPDTLVLSVDGARPTALCIFVQGSNASAAPLPFADGLRCVSGSQLRLYTKNASGGAAAAPTAGEPGIRARAAALGAPIALGETRTYQVYYRDVDPSFCPAPAGGFANLSNALRFTW
jgi:hypothetical protein